MGPAVGAGAALPDVSVAAVLASEMTEPARFVALLYALPTAPVAVLKAPSAPEVMVLMMLPPASVTVEKAPAAPSVALLKTSCPPEVTVLNTPPPTEERT